MLNFKHKDYLGLELFDKQVLTTKRLVFQSCSSFQQGWVRVRMDSQLVEVKVNLHSSGVTVTPPASKIQPCIIPGSSSSESEEITEVTVCSSAS